MVATKLGIYIYIFIYYYPWLVYELSKTIFLADPSFQCNLFTSSSGTNEIFTNLLYDLTPYHIYKKKKKIIYYIKMK